VAFIHKVYLDGNLLTNEPGGLGVLDSPQFDIIREGGVTSDAHILRQKTDLELTFFGDGYTYLCQKKQENYCQDIEVKIYVECESYKTLRFSGLIQLINTTTDPYKQTIKSQIKDNSWSGLIKERQNNKVFLTATKSATGETITQAPSRIITMFNSTGAYQPNLIRVWDVYQVMKWLIKQYSNDTVTVISDYFTTGAGYNKYAITMGGMLYGGLSWTGQNALPKYFTPQVSFAEVFKEVRKKLRIYMSVDVDNLGNPTIRIEPEAYFFSNTQLFDVGDLPFDLIETYDKEQIYSEVKVGSSETKVDDGTYYTYPKLLLDAWEIETYQNCSECVTENALDLVSDWIIDSNVIHFTLEQPTITDDIPANVINGDKVFLIETKQTVDEAEDYELNGDFYYNNLLTNRNVFQNWAGGIPACVAEYFAGLCVDSCSSTSIDEINSTPESPPINFDNAECDVTTLFTEDIDFTWASGATSPATLAVVSGTGSYFVAPADGYYNFNLSGFFNYSGVAGLSPQGFLALVFPDSSHITSGVSESGNEIAYFYDYESFNNESKTINLNISTNLSNGNTIVFILLYGEVTLPYVRISNICLDLVEYDISQSFNFVSNDFLRKPIKWEFTHSLCEDEWNAILQDKTGYGVVAGKPGWLHNVGYVAEKKTRLILISNHTLCC
jgi:hypothetical protein